MRGWDKGNGAAHQALFHASDLIDAQSIIASDKSKR